MKLPFQDYGYYELSLIITILVILLSSWAFIEVTDEILENEAREFDKQVLLMMRAEANLSQPVGPHWLPEVMRDLSALGSKSVLTVVVLSVVGFLVLRKQYQSALLIAAVSFTGVLAVVFLKLMFARERPDIIPYLTEVSTQSYPSGHTMMSAVIYLSLASMLANIQQKKRVKIYSILIALILTMLVGVSRLYLGVHYPTDVMAGWSVGLVWAALGWLVIELRGWGHMSPE